MYRVLIVEDDFVIAEAMKKSIAAWGYEVECAKDFKDILAEFAKVDPQLVLLDISLPFYNGYHWCSEIRKISKVPIIFISSAADNMNIIMAMNMGADDFIAKPFDLSVLTAKVQAIMRRSYDFGGQTHLLMLRDVILDTSDATLSFKGEKTDLTRNEFKIMQLLMENKEKVVSREAIMTRLWQTDSYVDDNTLTVNVNRLRNKLAAIGLKDFIVTKKGMGYMVK